MLNPFPELLTYGIFAPALLRAAAALAFFYIAYVLTKKRPEQLETLWPLVGKPKRWLLRSAAVIDALIGLALFAGYNTQWAALFGAFVALKCFVWKRRHPALIPLSRIASLLLLVICLSLLLSGAGQPAFDLRL